MLVGCKLGLVKVNVQAYADDIVLLSPTSGDLRRFVEILRDLILDADLVANLVKTVVIFFYPTGQHNGTDPCFYLYDIRLEIVEEYKY